MPGVRASSTFVLGFGRFTERTLREQIGEPFTSNQAREIFKLFLDGRTGANAQAQLWGGLWSDISQMMQKLGHTRGASSAKNVPVLSARAGSRPAKVSRLRSTNDRSVRRRQRWELPAV